MKFLMVYPRFKYPTGDPPIGPASLVAYLREKFPEWTFDLFDATFKPDIGLIGRKISRFRPNMVGIYCNTLMYGKVVEVARIAKKAGAIVVVGGPHATVAPESLIRHSSIDLVVHGEGELPMEFILSRFPDIDECDSHPSILTKNSVGKELTSTLVDDLDSLPFPAYDLLDMERYIQTWFQMDLVSPRLRGTNIVASRGCPFRCSFCQPTLDRLFGKKPRIKKPERIIEQIKFLKHSYGINSFILDDDTLTVHRKWLEKFASLLVSERLGMTWGCNTRVGLIPPELMKLLARSGYRRMMMGIESGSQRVLDEIYNKGIDLTMVPGFVALAKRHGIRVFCYFMIGAPTETVREIKKTMDLAFSLPIDEATFSITTPLPGTYLESKLVELGYPVRKEFQKIDYYTPTGAISDLHPFILRFYQRVAFIKFYLHPRRWRMVFNSLLSIEGIRKAMLKFLRLL